jgi:O-methyltransferase involved in polyketide biosynthesis
MRSTKNEKTIQDKSSLKALTAIWAFMRGQQNNAHLFGEKELRLTRNIVNAIIATEPSYFYWGMARTVYSMPNSVQRGFFNQMISTGYDQAVFGRKLLIKQKIDQAVAKGVQQIVFVGSGYDLRPFIAANCYPDVKFYELDCGAIRQLKLTLLMQTPSSSISTEILSEGAYVLNDNLYSIQFDLSYNDVSMALRKYGFIQNADSLFVAEEITSRTHHLHIEKMLGSIRELLTDNSELFISFTESNHRMTPDGSEAKPETLIVPDHMMHFAQISGFHLKEKKLSADLLEDLGDMDEANIHRRLDLSNENYFTLVKNVAGMEQRLPLFITEIPDMKLNIPRPPVNLQEKNSPCQIL